VFVACHERGEGATEDDAHDRSNKVMHIFPINGSYFYDASSCHYEDIMFQEIAALD
jgi:hypothetical protein